MKEPTATRKTLLTIAGALWMIVGLALLWVSIAWLSPITPNRYLYLSIGIIGGVLIHHYGLSRIVEKNRSRIHDLSPEKERVCIFAFQNIRGYFIVMFMIFLGSTLRHSSIPKLYLSPAYTAMGLALLLSSLRYFRARNST